VHYLNVFVRMSIIYVKIDYYIVSDDGMWTVTAYENENLHLRHLHSSDFTQF